MRSRTTGTDTAAFPRTRREARLAERRAAQAGPTAEPRSGSATWDGRIVDPVLIEPDDVQAVRRPGPLPVQRSASADERIRPAGLVPQQLVPQQLVPQQLVPQQLAPQQLAPQQLAPFARQQASPLPPLPLRPPVPVGEVQVPAPAPAPVYLVDGQQPFGPAPAGRHAAGATGLGHRLGSLAMSASGPGAPRPRGRRAR